jgi:hypothetical protein
MAHRKSRSGSFGDWENFIKSLEFDVTDVNLDISPVMITVGEVVIGSRVNQRVSGYKTVTKLGVEEFAPAHAPSVVKKLVFEGPLSVEKGDRIIAYIPAAGMKVLGYYPDDGVRFEKRELGLEEKAYMIKKLDKDGFPAVTYRMKVTPEFFHGD